MTAQSKVFVVTKSTGAAHQISVSGRDCWALERLIEAGATGCKPYDEPAPRWSAYVHQLRRTHGVQINTIYETHGGEFPGVHGRYVLVDHVEPVRRPGAAA